jgi:hypothetical protein
MAIEITPDERVKLDEIYALLRKALSDGVPIEVIREELESAYRSHMIWYQEPRK